MRSAQPNGLDREGRPPGEVPAGGRAAPAVQAGAIDRDDADVYARWFQALADSTRIIILSYLSRQHGPVAVGTIAADLGVAQSTISHHLRTLYDVGFVTRTRIGTSRLYAVNSNCITRFPEAAEVIMGRLPGRPD